MKNSKILKDLNLDWTVNKAPVKFENLQGEIITSENEHIIYRDDTNEILGNCKSGYEITQNERTLETLQDLSQATGLTLDRGGSIKGGKRIYIQMKQAEGFEINGDKVQPYIYALNSHDGSTSLCFGNSNHVFSCSNQFYTRHKAAGIKIRHTSNAQNKLDEYIQYVQNLQVRNLSLKTEFQNWSKKKATMDTARQLILSLEGVDIKLAKDKNMALHSTRKLNKVDSMVECLESEMKSKGQNFWGLFNGITYYTNHKLGANSKIPMDEKLIEGTGFKTNNLAFDWVESQLN